MGTCEDESGCLHLAPNQCAECGKKLCDKHTEWDRGDKICADCLKERQRHEQSYEIVTGRGGQKGRKVHSDGIFQL